MSGPLESMCVVLVRTQGPVNLGMVARLCGNLGCHDLRLVSPVCVVDCADARRFSTHARDLLLNAPIFGTVAEAVGDCSLVIGSSARVRSGDHGAPMTLADLPALMARRPSRRTALVFGNEADGLDDDELGHCQAFFRIETYGDITSYNLSHAVALTLYTLAQGLSRPASPVADAVEGADRVHVDRLSAFWIETLDRFGYFRRTERARFAPQLRRLLNRLPMSKHDVQILRGMLAQFNYRAFGSREPPAAVGEGAGASAATPLAGRVRDGRKATKTGPKPPAAARKAKSKKPSPAPRARRTASAPVPAQRRKRS